MFDFSLFIGMFFLGFVILNVQKESQWNGFANNAFVCFPVSLPALGCYQGEVKFQLSEAATRSCFVKEVFKNFVEFTEMQFLF